MRRFLDVKIAKLLLFLVLISLVSGNIENEIICIEENGQVALESPINGRCGADGISEYANDHCPRCTDIQLSYSAEVNNFSTKIKNTVAVSNVYSMVDTTHSNFGSYPNPPESRFFSHDFLSSVIIRI
jgi:hypothetical protein